MNTNKPQFKHDCNDCKFLGRYTTPSGVACDLYFCPQGGRIPTVIARYSDEGSDYNSGLGFPMPELEEAARRAVVQGHLEKAPVLAEVLQSRYDAMDEMFEANFNQAMDAAEARS